MACASIKTRKTSHHSMDKSIIKEDLVMDQTRWRIATEIRQTNRHSVRLMMMVIMMNKDRDYTRRQSTPENLLV